MSAPTKCSVPMAEPLRRTLADLLGRPVELKASPGAMKTITKGVIAEYARADGTAVGLYVVDLPFAAYAGAALSMVPVGVASESIRAGKLEPNLMENAREVFNILGSQLNAPGFPHCSLKTVHAIPGPLPPTVTAIVAKPLARLELAVTIGGYGAGVFATLVG